MQGVQHRTYMQAPSDLALFHSAPNPNYHIPHALWLLSVLPAVDYHPSLHFCLRIQTAECHVVWGAA